MIKFNGFDDWIPIFRGGKQIDSSGREHDGDALIDKAVASFNASRHEPPVVIGHPAENAPAWGWVEGLQRQGNMLLAKFKQVQPEFEEMVKRGRFKKRSAAFYPDGTLRHVGFLGAMPPAVKGLPDLAFAEPPAAIFEFAEDWKWTSLSNVFRSLREWMIEKFDQDTADRIVPNWTIEEIRAAPEMEMPIISPNYKEQKEEAMNFKEFIQKLKDLVAGVEPADQTGLNAGKTFSEAELADAKKAAAEEAAKAEREKMAGEFAETARKTRQDARRREIASWCESMVKEGKMTPSWVKFGIPEFMAAFAEREDVLEFGEAKDKSTIYDRFKAFFETELPKVVEFREVATRDKDTGGQGQAGSKVEALIRAKMKEKQDLSYGSAFAEVQRENPDLAREYQQELGG